MPSLRKPWARGKQLLLGGTDASLGPLASALQAVGFDVAQARSETDALAAIEATPPAAVVASSRMGVVAVSGIISCASHQHPEVPVIVLGGAGTVQEAVDAIQHGAADYLSEQTDIATLVSRLKRALERFREPQPAPPEVEPGFMGLIGSSDSIGRVRGAIEKISRYRTNVLVLGESGTGKELVARALHARGPRRQRLFVPLNCATLGREILENELFGHERGAFTGANEKKRGLFELADGGTLFLDEIAEMDPSTQAKLLRVLERNEFRRVGGSSKVKVDLSIVAATNRDLVEGVRLGKFREDLYYRLKVVTIRVPPLRERTEDIPELIRAFVGDFNRRHGQKIRGVEPVAMKVLLGHPWPGNVRELKNTIDSAAILAGGDRIDAAAIDDILAAPAGRSARPDTATRTGDVVIRDGMTLADAERELIVATVRRHPTRSEAARALGIGLRTLFTKLRQYERTR